MSNCISVSDGKHTWTLGVCSSRSTVPLVEDCGPMSDCFTRRRVLGPDCSADYGGGGGGGVGVGWGV